MNNESATADYPGNLFVVSAPSGAGKSSLVKALMELDAGVSASISHTTRAPRGQELDGREYHFVDPQRFDQMVAHGEFLEWANVHGNRYGTSRQAVLQLISSGQDVMLEIDYQGALQVRRIFPQAMGEADQAMKGAADALGQGRLGEAVPNQTRALDA